MPYTFVSHTNAHAIRGRPTLKDVERFRNGSIHEFYSLKALKTLKNVNTSDVEKITDLDEQNLDVDRNNNKQSTTLDKEKDIQRNNLNCEFLSLTLVLNIPTVLFVFIVINTCKRFDSVNIITAIVVQGMVNVGLYCAWNCTCLVEDTLNYLDDCDLLEKSSIWLMYMNIMMF